MVILLFLLQLFVALALLGITFLNAKFSIKPTNPWNKMLFAFVQRHRGRGVFNPDFPFRTRIPPRGDAYQIRHLRVTCDGAED